MTSLADCLIANKNILGTNFENLGKFQKNFSNSYKYMLSYNETKGFSLQKLSIIDLFMRNFGGRHKSTHLNHIYLTISKLTLSNEVESKVIARIHKLWTKKNVIGLGNSDISQAKLICFGDDHTDYPFHAYTTKTINDTYNEGDIVLIEGTEAGTMARTARTAGLKSECIIRGWEPENFLVLMGRPAQLAEKMSHDSNQCVELSMTFPRNDSICSTEISHFQSIHEYIKIQIEKLQNYYQAPLPVNYKTQLDEYFAEWKKNLNEAVLYQYYVCLLTRLFEKEQNNAYFRSYTPSDTASVIKGAAKRNISLRQEIITACKTAKKVYVLAGAAHLYKIYADDNSYYEVNKTLKKYHYIILTNKSEYSLGSSLLNPDLVEKSILL